MGLYLADCSPSGGTVPGDPPHAAFTGGRGGGDGEHGERKSDTARLEGPGVLGSTPGWDTREWVRGVRALHGVAQAGWGAGMELGSGLLCFRREGGFWNQRF